ncbi:hypothetical protein P6144_12505 [Sphingomonas sp. HITSZ_GF]|uniref:hypothetical protein n=1 Tax=Sphingomonas sp. HITSZ_GF TaxID=3037247 RepID=UPI00240E4C82|nr:hypothetical protein [Sphingomonas sp. HITSZ_GF]MDG2534475.1 hypothetical protein [Sphingomonas sp. HITSZ_GF]
MRLRVTALSTLLALATGGCTATPAPETPGELLVEGRLENLGYAPLDDPDDLLGHGVITARLHISRVVRGHVRGSVITVRYVAHTYLQGRARAVYRLRRDESGAYLLCGPRGGTGYVCS